MSEKLGEQYGGYIRQAADAVSGLASTLRDKDPDELIDDARNVVRSSPAVAIAAAAAVGFLMARVVKSGLTPGASNDEPASPAARKRAPRRSAEPKTSPQVASEIAPEATPGTSSLAGVPIANMPAPDGTPPAA